METINSTLRDEDNLKGIPKLNLQLFADVEGSGDGEGTGEGDSTNQGQGQDNNTDNSSETKTYTQEELNQLLQKEGDRRVTSAREKFEKEFKEKLEKEKSEAERLANLSADEKEKELLEQSKKDIETREKAIKQKELKLDAIDVLSDRKLPIKFADMLLKDDAESTMENIKLFEKEWESAIDAAVTEKLKKKSPGFGNEDGARSTSSIANSRNKEYKPEINPWG